MERTVGVICEYNPLHRGHVEQLRILRARFPEKPIVLAMSGNFVQRGEAAVCDRYARARAAVLCGADLVFLLPFPYSTFGARGYAESAVRLLSSLGVVDTLAFGAEAGADERLKLCAKVLNSAAFEKKMHRMLTADPRAAYAHLRAEALDSFVPGAGELLKESNNILAVEYLSAIARNSPDLAPCILERPADPSATALRARLLKKEAISADELPVLSEKLLGGTLPQEKFSEMLLAALRAGLHCPELAALGDRIPSAARKAVDFEDFLARAKTRKVPVARIRRAVLHAYFGVEEADFPPISHTLLLAANERGRAVLSFIYNNGSIPVYTKPSAPCKEEGVVGETARLQAAADSVYAGLVGSAGDWFLKQNPEIVNKL